MTNTDFIPRSDADFNEWQDSLIKIVELNLVIWGILQDDFTNVKSKQSIWITKYSNASNKQNRTSADVTAKDDAREDYVKAIRPFVAQWLSFNNKVTDSDRNRMGLTVRVTTRTAVPVPTTSVEVSIDFSVLLQHIIHFYDKESSGSKAKPEGVHGCEIYMKVDGDTPVKNSELSYLTTCTATPYVVEFDREQAGKRVWYSFRWANTHGETGPWSVIYSAIIAG